MAGTGRSTSDTGEISPQYQAGKSSPGFARKHWRLLGIFLLLAIIAGLFFWKQIAVEQTRKEVTQKADNIITKQNTTFLQLAVTPLVWAVRSEMIRGNFDQINQYMISFVREPNVNEVVLVKPDGVVLLATNKSLEGTRATDSFPEAALQVETTMVTPLQNRGLMAASPIMGLNKKLGVLIIVYMPAQYTWE